MDSGPCRFTSSIVRTTKSSPYGPAEETALLLAERGHPVQMTRLTGASHNMMGDYVAPLRAAGEWMKEQWQAGEVEVGR